MQDFCKSAGALSAALLGKDAEYTRGTLCRKFLGLLERQFGDAVWDDLLMGQVLALVPDMNRHCQPLASMRCSLVRQRFGMSPLAVSAQACMWGMATGTQGLAEGLEKVKPLQILNTVSGMSRELALSQDSRNPIVGYPQPHEWVPEVLRLVRP